jgi:hypothetical protein
MNKDEIYKKYFDGAGTRFGTDFGCGECTDLIGIYLPGEFGRYRTAEKRIYYFLKELFYYIGIPENEKNTFLLLRSTDVIFDLLQSITEKDTYDK